MAGILIISAPRSGSSCTAGLLSLHGLSLGIDVATHTDKFNEKGYFENMEILNFNRSVLDDIGVDVFCTDPPTREQTQRSLDHVDRLNALFLDQFADRERFLIKDPRIALLQDLYLAALPDFKVVLLERRAEDVSASINRMRGFPPDKGWKVREVYMDMMDRLAQRTEHIRIHFEDLLDSLKSVRLLCEWSGLAFDKGKTVDFISGDLVHFRETK